MLSVNGASGSYRRQSSGLTPHHQSNMVFIFIGSEARLQLSHGSRFTLAFFRGLVN
jgi:hypothetical protein